MIPTEVSGLTLPSGSRSRTASFVLSSKVKTIAFLPLGMSIFPVMSAEAFTGTYPSFHSRSSSASNSFGVRS